MSARWRNSLFFVVLGAVFTIAACSGENEDAAPTPTPDAAGPILTFDTDSFPLPAQPERNTLFVIGEDGEGLTELASEETIFDVQWAPGGERLAYRSVTNRIATLSILTLEGGAIDDLVVGEDSGRGIDYLWGPDGDLVVALIEGAARVIQLDGTEIASFQATDLVEWSPDGQHLLVFREDMPNRPDGSLFLVEPGTWEPALLTTARRSSWHQDAWSPDSSTVSFLRQDIGPVTADCHGMFAVDLVDVNSGVVSQPMEPVCKAIQSHSWSPDGSSIALGVVEVGGEEPNGLRLLDLEEESLTQITEDRDFEAIWVGNQALAVHRASCWGCDGSQSWALVSSSGDELAEWPGRFPRLDVDEASNAIALGLPSGRLDLADRSGNTTDSLLDQAPFMFGELVWSPDHTQIAFVSWQGLTDTTYLASLADEQWQGLALPPDARGTAFSPDWQRVAYVLGRQLTVASADGSDAREFVDDVFAIRAAPAWSPDGSHIAFMRQTGSDRVELALVDPDSGQVRVLRDMGSADQTGRLSWSPDGNTVLLSVTSAGLSVQALLDIEGGQETPFGGLAAGSVAWSPDSKEVASIAEDGVQVLDAETFEQRTIMDLMKTSELAVPAWSPDGKTIAVFETDMAAQHAMVTLVAPDGEQLEEILLPVPAPDPWVNMRIYNDVLNAMWSPDGTQLALNYLSEDGLLHGVFVLDIETRELREVSLSSRSNYRHVILGWSPDGSQLVFESQWFQL